MNISLRFSGQTPIGTSGTERVRITLDSGFEFEIVENDDGGSWNSNPWIWAITFRRVESEARAA